MGKRGGRGNADYPPRGLWNRGGTSNPGGRGFNLGTYNLHSPQEGSFSSFGMNNDLRVGYSSFRQEPLNYNMPYNASYNDNPNFNKSFPQRLVAFTAYI